ncbi:hypothetical protein [Pradoshia eiseniae]|uniref:hypothetical protein n=1 Tax=Pradoshia eiseniae TaxID=2064768 RepID=UPI00191BEB63|nr:hypothetical protein [Pradoshia eiseniae]
MYPYGFGGPGYGPGFCPPPPCRGGFGAGYAILIILFILLFIFGFWVFFGGGYYGPPLK